MNIFCTMVGHDLNRRAVRRTRAGLVSLCRRCHAPMARTALAAPWHACDPLDVRFGAHRPARLGMVSLWELPRV